MKKFSKETKSRAPEDNYGDDFDPSYEDEYGIRRMDKKNYFGKGPRGYERSAQVILDEAYDKLTLDPDLDASGIDISFNDGIIILKGEVAARKDKRLAEDVVEDILGVRDVLNQLNIKNSVMDGWIPGVGSVKEVHDEDEGKKTES